MPEYLTVDQNGNVFWTDGKGGKRAATTEERNAYLTSRGIDPNKTPAQIGRGIRREMYSRGVGTQQQNSADIAADAEDKRRAVIAQQQAQLAGQRGANGGPGGYVDNAGVYHEQAPSLAGIAGGLSDSGSNISRGYNWGGVVGGAEAAAARAQGLAGAADKRGFIQGDYAMADQSRGSQQDALGLYKNAAYGNGPSVAQSMYQQNLDRGIAGAASLANSSRGGALALSQGRLASQGQAMNAFSGSSAQAAQLRAQEMQQAMAGYAGLGSQIRGQDQTQAQAQAQAALASQAQNDARNQAYEQQGYNVTAAQMQGQQARVNAQLGSLGITTGAQTANAALQAQQQANSENNTWKYISTAAGIAGAVGSAALGGYIASRPSGTDSAGAGGGGKASEGNSPDAGTSIGGAAGGAVDGGVAAASTPMGLSPLSQTKNTTEVPQEDPNRRMNQQGRALGWSPRRGF